MSRTLGIITASLLLACCSTKTAGRETTSEATAVTAMTEFEPAAMGKSSGPVGARVRYPRAHPLNQPLEISVELWASDGDAAELVATARPDDGLEWSKGNQEQRFSGPVPQNEPRTYTFTIIPRAAGAKSVAVDLQRVRDGVAASRTISVPIEAGGEVKPPPSAKERAPVRME